MNTQFIFLQIFLSCPLRLNLRCSWTGTQGKSWSRDFYFHEGFMWTTVNVLSPLCECTRCREALSRTQQRVVRRDGAACCHIYIHINDDTAGWKLRKQVFSGNVAERFYSYFQEVWGLWILTTAAPIPELFFKQVPINSSCLQKAVLLQSSWNV